MANTVNYLTKRSQHTAVTHFLFVGVYVIGLLIFDLWKLIPPEPLKTRWTLAIILTVITAVLWQLSKSTKSELAHRAIIYTFIGFDILLASLIVNLERGMSSNAVALYAVPLVVAALLKSTTALYTTATLCTAGYAAATIYYFLDHPFEGYRVELYGTLIFYSAMFYVTARFLQYFTRTP